MELIRRVYPIAKTKIVAYLVGILLLFLDALYFYKVGIANPSNILQPVEILAGDLIFFLALESFWIGYEWKD
jgi:hypothetical protein